MSLLRKPITTKFTVSETPLSTYSQLGTTVTTILKCRTQQRNSEEKYEWEDLWNCFCKHYGNIKPTQDIYFLCVFARACLKKGFSDTDKLFDI